MITIQTGPFGMSVLLLFVMGVAIILYQVFEAWSLRRRRHQKVHEVQALTGLIAKARQVLDQDREGVNRFIDRFGRDLVEELGTDVASVTLHDLRMHVECAVFDLVQGCDCGECSGVSDGRFFWIEAEFKEGGIVLHGLVRQEVTRSKIDATAEPAMASVAPGPNVTMICSKGCGTPVVTSIEHLGEGKRPICAKCVSREASGA